MKNAGWLILGVFDIIVGVLLVAMVISENRKTETEEETE